MNYTKTKRMTPNRRKELINNTGGLTVEERRPHLQEWEMSEEEFQTMKNRFEVYGLKGLQSTRIGHIRKKEQFDNI